MAAFANQEEECARIQALLERVGGRDEAALEELWKLIQRRVYGWIRSVLGPVDPEDAAQHVRIQLWYRTPAWEGCESFFGWVKRVARNAALDERDPRRGAGDLADDAPKDATVEQEIYEKELLSIVASVGLRDVEAPHQTLCLLANKFLGDSPLEIEPQRRTPLEAWLHEMAARCLRETPVTDEAAWNRWLLPLRASMRAQPLNPSYSGPPAWLVGQTCLNHYGLPADRREAANVITKWVLSAKRRLLAAIAVDWRTGRFPDEV
ncbi:MAG: sigma-70 family RNA polymerase sigma factor [Bryobacteraceae bacterium]|jgi:hypothetical protein